LEGKKDSRESRGDLTILPGHAPTTADTGNGIGLHRLESRAEAIRLLGQSGIAWYLPVTSLRFTFGGAAHALESLVTLPPTRKCNWGSA
jgi:hypothetical protein